MDIKSIKVEGYRNIDSISIDLDNITSLVSVNNFGKSNFLKGIIFGLKIIKERDKQFFLEYQPDMPVNKKNYQKDYVFEISFVYNECLVDYGYSFSWKDEQFIKEYLNIKEKNSQKFKAFIKRNEEAFYKPSETASCNRSIIIAKNELIINKLQAFDDLYYIDIVNQINSFTMYIDKHFDVYNSYCFHPIKHDSNSNLRYNLANDNNIPMILNNIRDVYPNKYDLIMNTFKDLFPNIVEIEALRMKTTIKVDNNIEFYTIGIKDKNIDNFIDFNLMSDSARKILLILTNLVLAEINNYSLVAIEEPENSLNLRILQQYLITLYSFTDKVKIIITSHSPYLINYLLPENIYVGVSNDDGIAKFAKIKKGAVSKLCNDAKELNMYTGDYLFDLMSSDDSEVEQILKYIE